MLRESWIALAILLALGFALAHTERNEQQAQHDHYCDMVQIWEESNHKYGWPNYENRECN